MNSYSAAEVEPGVYPEFWWTGLPPEKENGRHWYQHLRSQYGNHLETVVRRASMDAYIDANEELRNFDRLFGRKLKRARTHWDLFGVVQEGTEWLATRLGVDPIPPEGWEPHWVTRTTPVNPDRIESASKRLLKSFIQTYRAARQVVPTGSDLETLRRAARAQAEEEFADQCRSGRLDSPSIPLSSLGSPGAHWAARLTTDGAVGSPPAVSWVSTTKRAPGPKPAPKKRKLTEVETRRGALDEFERRVMSAIQAAPGTGLTAVQKASRMKFPQCKRALVGLENKGLIEDLGTQNRPRYFVK